ncbi:SpaA isopeptide-forming pilin-related protein [Eubacterium sp. 1001713B170207_170306_E7]|uniref:MSCRAMM family protein n=1 Tax=Eubacterium sp. 1001713B170207_170306_E7 TaxID=2787097 RepID=UPI0018990C3D|nr:SpaA isopeptide-forming pilin-related protein [Eubacterium sp. 1001713B170207_170306_E7]
MKKLTGTLTVLIMVILFSFSPVWAAQGGEGKAAPTPTAAEQAQEPKDKTPVEAQESGEAASGPGDSSAIAAEKAAVLKSGNYYTFKLPDSVIITEELSLPLTEKDGRLYGTAYVGTDGVVIIALTEEAAEDAVVTDRLEAAGAEPAAVQTLGDTSGPQGSVVFRKQDENGNGLEGARFELLKTDDNNRTVAAVTSGGDGSVRCDALSPGAYRVVETQAPAGYLLNRETVAFTVPDSAQTQAVVVDAGVHTGYQGRLMILKMDEERDPLAGATFKILDANGYTLQKDLVTGADGQIWVSNLAPGRYQVMETEAPAGYHLDATPVSFEVSDAAQGEPAAMEVKAVNVRRASKLKYSTGAASPNADTGVDGMDFLGLGFVMLAAVTAAGVMAYQKSKRK